MNIREKQIIANNGEFILIDPTLAKPRVPLERPIPRENPYVPDPFPREIPAPNSVPEPVSPVIAPPEPVPVGS